MTADTITIAALSDLILSLEDAAHNVKRIQLLSMDGQMTTGEAAAEVNMLIQTVNKAAQ